MVEKEWAPASLLDVFGDPIARATLILANQRTVSVADLAEQFEISEQTVYRRVNELVESDLLKEHQRIGEDGNQYMEYETLVDEITFAIDDDGYTLDVQTRQDLTDDFGALWADLDSPETELTHERSNGPDGAGGDPA